MNTKEKVFVGMDLHKSTSTFCAKTKDGDILAERKIVTNPEEVKTFIHSLGKRDVALVLEPVSQWHFYADFIERMGVEVRMAHPARVKAIASARIKTDKIDAGVLADLLRTNLVPEAYRSPVSIRAHKELVRLRGSLVHDRTQLKNRVHAILFKNALESPEGNLFGKAGRAWLSSLTLPEYYQRSLVTHLALIDEYEASIKCIEREVIATANETPWIALLLSIPGIGHVTALTIAAEVGDITRFHSAKHLQSYAGLVPSTYSSGGVVRHGSITRQGSKWLRYIMIEVAHAQLRCKRVRGFRSYYMRMKVRTNTQTAAVATARKLLAVVFRVLSDNRPFEERPPIAHQVNFVS
jgi:transposase